MLRAANLVAAAPIDRVTSSHAAVVRLGLSTVKSIVTGSIVSAQVRDVSDSVLRMNELWRHVVATGLLAEAASTGGDRGTAFTAGLLHDLGRLALVAHSAARYSRVVDTRREGG